MSATADAVVIGGGILGVSTAHFLARLGFGSVVLLEKRTLAAVSTGHSAAAIRTFYSNPLTIRLAIRSAGMFAGAQETFGGSCGFRQSGYLTLLDEDSLDQGRQVAEMERQQGVPVEELSPEALRERFPVVDLERVRAGIFEPRSGYADPLTTTGCWRQRPKAGA